ncbi:MAG: ABC transporter [Actinomycetia bacterium]|nr:ABC transporter [Actinomycetes bacterium]
MADPNPASLATALDRLASALEATGLDLDLDLAIEGRSVRTELHDQIRDYLIPRLRRLDAPLLAVLGGSTGSGKSTIVNTLVGAPVSLAGVLRPTTRAPVLVCHPDDLAWFGGDDILPELPRVTGEDSTNQGTVLRTVAVEGLAPGVAIIDAPDIDSVELANRTLATQLLAAADLWLFTTTAVRYADAVPWDFLRQAQARGTTLAVIINRIPAGAGDEIVAHFKSMLVDASLDDVIVFPIEDHELVEGMLPSGSVDELVFMLRRLADDINERAEVVAHTLIGAMASIGPRTGTVIAAADEQSKVADELRLAMEEVYENARNNLGADISGGNLLRGEVLDRWQELIGTAELMRVVQSRIGRIRDRITGFVTGRTIATSEVQGEITSTLERLLVDHADAAALLAVTRWRSAPGGRQVIDDDRSLERSSPEFRAQIGSEIRAWQDDILGLVRDRGASKRATARALALGLNSIGVALMIVLFAQTGGITGGEIAISAGTAGLSQTLLTAIFGEQAVRELATEARRLLLERVAAMLDLDANRFRVKLWSNLSPPETVDELRAALTNFEQNR